MKTTLRERLRYKADQFFQSGFTLQVTIAFLIVAAIITVFSVFAHIGGLTAGPDFEAVPLDTYWPSVQFWWVLNHIFDTYWIEVGPLEQFLASLLTLINYLVFAGVIGLVGTKIANRLESIRRGTSRVIENRHFVILGWSEKIFPIIHQLAIGLEGESKVFVILSSRPVDEMETDLRRSVPRKRGLRWVLRTGSPTDEASLGMLSLPSARAVVILQPSEAFDAASSVAADTQVVKSILTVSHILQSSGEQPQSAPVLIAELARPDMHDIATAAAGRNQVKIIQTAEYIGELLLQTSRRSGIINVYKEILSHEGHELHVARFPGLEGMPWRDVVMSFREAIPVGYIHGDRTQLLPFRYDPGQQLPPGSHIIALARDENAFRKTGEPMHYEPATSHGIEGNAAAAGVRILLLGLDVKLKRMISELDAWAAELGVKSEVVVASPFITEHNTQLLDRASDSVSIVFEKLEYLNKETLDQLRPQTFDSIIVIGETSLGSIEETDARVVMTLLLLQSLRLRQGMAQGNETHKPSVVAEIRNPANRKLAEVVGLAQDIVITNELVSQFIAQICREPRLDDTLRDLLDEKGVEIYFKPMTWYAAEGQTVPFGRLLAASLDRGEIAIGFDHHEDATVAGPSLVLNPGREAKVKVRNGMRLCVLAETEM